MDSYALRDGWLESVQADHRKSVWVESTSGKRQLPKFDARSAAVRIAHEQLFALPATVADLQESAMPPDSRRILAVGCHEGDLPRTVTSGGDLR